MPTKKNGKTRRKATNAYTRYYDAQKSLPVRRESVYVLSKRQRQEQQEQQSRQIKLLPDCRTLAKGRPVRRPCNDVDHFMVVTEDHTQSRQQKNQLITGAPQLDAICYDVMREPLPPVHMEGTDIVPTIRGTRLSICAEHTHFPLVSRIARSMGFQQVPEHRLWNVQWTDCTPHHDLLRGMKRFQQINHFPGMVEICRKDLLSRNLNRMLKMYPGDYRIFPKTWLMPTDAYDVAIYASKHKRTYILKPYSSGRGRGIWITPDLKTVGKREKLICQTYIERPLLIDGFKFDLRVYTLITSVDPLRIFVYNEGLARFATHKYVAPTLGNSHNVYMHLTNYSLNRRNSNYNVGEGADGGSKRKLSAFNKWLLEHGYDVPEFWASVDDAIIKTIISAWPVLKHNYHVCFPRHDKIQGCFQLLGFDILVDWKLKPYILEVNHTPSLSADELVDKEVKRALIRDTLNLLTTALVDKEQIIRDDRIEHRTRLLRKVYQSKRGMPQTTPGSLPSPGREAGGCAMHMGQACSIGALAQQIAWEESHLGNYRRIMPPRDSERVNYYCKFYDQTKHQTLFANTESSRRREQLAHKAMQRHYRENQQQEVLKQQQRKQKDPLLTVSPAVLHSRRRKEEAEAQRCKHRAIIAREIYRQRELLLAPTCAKEHLGIWQSVLKIPKVEKRPRVRVVRCTSGVSRPLRRKQQRNVSRRVRQQRDIEHEAREDTLFVEQHAMKQSPRCQGGTSQQSVAKNRSRSQTPICRSMDEWAPGTISDGEQQEHSTWLLERTKQLNGSNLREMIFSKMYQQGHLTKNDIKRFPDLLFHMLSTGVPTVDNL
ncbi:tubulin polyglutamylase ttll6 [Drosophila guanche]|uniref:Blast:Tubulin polyglutamylase TTLL13 n=1 Tax=Drosophila guanche TaxID=7266 RepID=A0A3B0J2P5_DROGU|nr:tubulin polyglutamylase ttll6 [Drosophila guanche]SPP75475.1 blast:Tubulin polyglutamylase TTLL13 [Drosophila guanche]